MTQAHTWGIVELDFTAESKVDNPYSEITMNVVFTSPFGDTYSSPGFWDGAQRWKVRFAPNAPGRWEWKSSSEEKGLHDKRGFFEVMNYSGDHPIYQHGFIKARERGFVHDDDTPFFWLGDTVWSISAHAHKEEWQSYLNARSSQGFNVVQINSLPQWDASSGDFRKPFVEIAGNYDYNQLNEHYYQYLDDLMRSSVEAGMVTAMVVLWFNYVPETNVNWGKQWKKPMNVEEAKAFASYLTARYAAYGTVWLISGDTDYESRIAEDIYDAAAAAVKRSSPYPAMLTAHLNGGLYTPEAMNEKSWIDFHMFQSCHVPDSADKALLYAEKDRAYEPVRPVINGEPCYDYLRLMDKGNIEGRLIDRDMVRETAWTSMLGGGNAGFTYGAHGLWPWHRSGQSYESMNYGMPLPWEEALQLESGNDMIRMKSLLEQLSWWELAPMQGVTTDTAEPVRIVASSTNNKREMVIYTSESCMLDIKLANGAAYSGQWYNPQTGEQETAQLTTMTTGIRIHPPLWIGDAVLTIKIST